MTFARCNCGTTIWEHWKFCGAWGMVCRLFAGWRAAHRCEWSAPRIVSNKVWRAASGFAHLRNRSCSPHLVQKAGAMSPICSCKHVDRLGPRFPYSWAFLGAAAIPNSCPVIRLCRNSPEAFGKPRRAIARARYTSFRRSARQLVSGRERWRKERPTRRSMLSESAREGEHAQYQNIVAHFPFYRL